MGWVLAKFVHIKQLFEHGPPRQQKQVNYRKYPGRRAQRRAQNSATERERVREREGDSKRRVCVQEMSAM